MVTELVLFHVADGVSDEEFLAAAKATFDLLKGYEGYLDRELSKNDEGQWVDIVHWRDLDTAQHAAEQIMSDPIGQTFGSKINPETIQMMHLHHQHRDSVTA